MPKRSSTIIAETFGWDASEVAECAYQPTRIRSPLVYTVGDDYYACSQAKPKHVVGLPWELHPDQFWAGHAHTKMWRSKVSK